MKHLLSDANTLRMLYAARHLGIFLDFDGTLVPLADHPYHIQVPGEVVPLLTALTQKDGYTVGIITGRMLPSLTRFLTPPPGVLIGASHGLEWVIDGKYEHVPLPDGYLTALKNAYAEIAAYADEEPDVDIYWKEISFSVHLRRVPASRFDSVKTRVLTIVHRMDADGLFSVIPGRTDFDVRPSIDWTKANLLSHFLSLRHVDLTETPIIYIGDDTTDEDVFRAFPSSVTVHVGRNADTRANYFLSDVPEVLSFLGTLVRM